MNTEQDRRIEEIELINKQMDEIRARLYNKEFDIHMSFPQVIRVIAGHVDNGQRYVVANPTAKDAPVIHYYSAFIYSTGGEASQLFTGKEYSEVCAEARVLIPSLRYYYSSPLVLDFSHVEGRAVPLTVKIKYMRLGKEGEGHDYVEVAKREEAEFFSIYDRSADQHLHYVEDVKKWEEAVAIAEARCAWFGCSLEAFL